jgi:NAD(P)H-dependent flavin oxidoreductase YrpB (nitropropane dioxygenase family)
VYARGGIGVHTASGCKAIGACGVILDDQLLLTEESPLPNEWRRRLAGSTGQDTIVFGQGTAHQCRVFNRPTCAGVTKLKEISDQMELGNSSEEKWRSAIAKYVWWGSPYETAWPIGQSVGLAETFSRQYKTVAGVVRAITEGSIHFSHLAKQQRALSPDSPLARSHGTKYPIVQGPMTRVSDRPQFAHAVATAGALPLIALALLPGSQARPILETTRTLLGPLPWGVGILGFSPPEVRREQVAEILRVKPSVVVIAGGRADIAKELEHNDIKTYLHAPVPSLLRRMLKDGLHRFIFEGRECGGHVGPLCSFPLWEAMIGVLLESIPPYKCSELHLLFAGGIHDAYSAAFIAAMAAPLITKGMRVGVLIGTAYIFTKEAVESGAIVPRYQREALLCKKTVLLKSGVGHCIRVANTAFALEFDRQRQCFAKAGRTAEEIKADLDRVMAGRLRIATKGVLRGDRGELIAADEETQARNGAYMLGQLATLRASVCTIAELHRNVCEEAMNLMESD